MRYRSHDTTGMSADEAVELLDGELGSGQDPIIYRQEEMTPIDLQHKLQRQGGCGDWAAAARVRITYWGDVDGKLMSVRGGTLKGMVEDRIRLRLTRKESMPDLTLREVREAAELEFWKLLPKIREADRESAARLCNKLRALR